MTNQKYFNKNSTIKEVIENPNFEGFGNLIFPLNQTYFKANTLNDISLAWYTCIDPNKTVEIINYFYNHSKCNEKFFFDIYSEKEKKNDPSKKNTGLFFFKGDPYKNFAIVNAGGGFQYVAAIHDSFPHALELSKKDYNAFALIYRPNAYLAMKDLARAISFIFKNSNKLKVRTDNYSLWGGSAGARMVAYLGSLGTGYFKEKDYPKPSSLIMQYTGFSQVFGNEPPTYNCVGTSDFIANYKIMENRINNLKSLGIPANIDIFKGLSHGFGLGKNTIAHGWLNNAVKFWEKNQLKGSTNENIIY